MNPIRFLSRHRMLVLACAALLCTTTWVGAAQELLPPVAARYLVTVLGEEGEKSFTWYLYRRPAEVVAINADSRTMEVWRRGPGAETTLLRIFDTERKIVEYSWGELRVRGIEPSWTALGSVVDPAVVAKLRTLGPEKVLGHAATRRALDASPEPASLVWVDDVGLPARIELGRGKARVRLELAALRDAPAPDWPEVPTREALDLDGYERIDIADFGDKHEDPFVRYVEKLDAEGVAGGYFTHEHSGH